MTFDQREFEVRCEWGEQGVALLAPISDAVIIVDVLSFSTAVDIAVQRGAVVFPFRQKEHDLAEFAASVDAVLADPKRSGGRYSLSPESLNRIEEGTRIVLPSPNGSTLSLAAKATPVFAGCLRNARAVASAASTCGPKIAVIPAGERWREDHSLRPAFEDQIGAGAIISYLRGRLSPEAAIALAAFREAKPKLHDFLRQCSSGKELIQRGFAKDVELASQMNVSDTAPILMGDAFVRAETRRL